MAALAESGDLTDPLQVAAIWWLALLHREEYAEQLRWLTHAPEAWGDFEWAADLLSEKSIASKVYYAVDNPTHVAVVRFVPEVADTAKASASFIVRGVIFLTLCRYQEHMAGLGARASDGLCPSHHRVKDSM